MTMRVSLSAPGCRAFDCGSGGDSNPIRDRMPKSYGSTGPVRCRHGHLACPHPVGTPIQLADQRSVTTWTRLLRQGHTPGQIEAQLAAERWQRWGYAIVLPTDRSLATNGGTSLVRTAGPDRC
jgi:hypothetical protein